MDNQIIEQEKNKKVFENLGIKELIARVKKNFPEKELVFKSDLDVDGLNSDSVLCFVGKNFDSDIKEKSVLISKANIMQSRKLTINVYDPSDLDKLAKNNNVAFAPVSDVFHKWFVGVVYQPEKAENKVKITEKEAEKLGVDIPSNQEPEPEKEEKPEKAEKKQKKTKAKK